MQTMTTPTPSSPVLRDVRCSCGVCGAHVIAWQGRTLSGECGNCGSYDVHPLAGAPETAGC